MKSTQEHIPIADIKDGIVILKDGGGAMVLQISAVNFGLLSEREQIGIIAAFAQMLNSLSFSIQIVIQTERLDISSYLDLLDKARVVQTNPLLSSMMINYKNFIQTTIKENEILDKKFYIIIPLFMLEIGLIKSMEILQQKIKTVLIPRRDQIVRQLERVGLKATQLDNQKLLQVFFGIYNGPISEITLENRANLSRIDVKLKNPLQSIPSKTFQQASTPQVETAVQKAQSQPNPSSRNHPFVVEELED